MNGVASTKYICTWIWTSSHTSNISLSISQTTKITTIGTSFSFIDLVQWQEVIEYHITIIYFVWSICTDVNSLFIVAILARFEWLNIEIFCINCILCQSATETSGKVVQYCDLRWIWTIDMNLERWERGMCLKLYNQFNISIEWSF